MGDAVAATVANMRKHAHVPGMVMFSPWTGEEYSANGADYWHSDPDKIFTDSEGNEMWLVCKETTIRDVGGY